VIATTDAAFVAWVREHSRISAHTLRRRFRVTPTQADGMIAGLVDGRRLGREPEGESYRVLYRRGGDLTAVVRTSEVG
jgi:hypothetical protein